MPWWEVFDAKIENLEEISNQILDLYENVDAIKSSTTPSQPPSSASQESDKNKDSMKSPFRMDSFDANAHQEPPKLEPPSSVPRETDSPTGLHPGDNNNNNNNNNNNINDSHSGENRPSPSSSGGPMRHDRDPSRYHDNRERRGPPPSSSGSSSSSHPRNYPPPHSTHHHTPPQRTGASPKPPSTTPPQSTSATTTPPERPITSPSTNGPSRSNASSGTHTNESSTEPPIRESGEHKRKSYAD